MMRSAWPSIIAVWLAAALPVKVPAVALANLATGEKKPSATPSIYETFNWDYVYNYNGASGCAVDHYWLLTAAHVAGSGNLQINGETYIQQEVVRHSKAADPDGNETADIALIRYDKPFPGYYLLNDEVPLGADVVICGYGYGGAVISTGSDAYFTQDTTSGHSTRRWGTNRINYERTFSSTVPIVATSKCFDISISKKGSGKTVYEAGCNVFDSGGGMFCNDGGVWKLTGHMIVRFSSGGQARGNYAVATKYYVNWIKSVIVDYDSDMDGLPDWWESQYAGDPFSMEQDGHDDSDTLTNYDEWLADTIPTDGSSYLNVALSAQPFSVVFNSSTSRAYQVQSRSSLGDSNTTWEVEVDWFTPAGSETSIPISPVDPNRYYRVRSRLQ